MKKFIILIFLNLLITNCFSNNHQNEFLNNKNSNKVNRQSQPINIVNLSISGVELKQILSTLQQLQSTQNTASPYESSKQTLQTLGTYIGNIIDRYKYWLPITTVSFVYCAIYYKISLTNKLLNTKDAWLNWKSDITFSKLLSESPKDLTQDLINDIQKKYTDQKNPTNFISPLVAFTNDINNEVTELESYVKIVNSIESCKLNKMYPTITQNKIDEAKEKINKLIYLKNIFTQWSVDFKQQQLQATINNTNS